MIFLDLRLCKKSSFHSMHKKRDLKNSPSVKTAPRQDAGPSSLIQTGKVTPKSFFKHLSSSINTHFTIKSRFENKTYKNLKWCSGMTGSYVKEVKTRQILYILFFVTSDIRTYRQLISYLCQRRPTLSKEWDHLFPDLFLLLF